MQKVDMSRLIFLYERMSFLAEEAKSLAPAAFSLIFVRSKDINSSSDSSILERFSSRVAKEGLDSLQVPTPA